MLSINDFPSNKEHFILLIDFCKEIIDICNKLKIQPIIYGSLAVFVYTKKKGMNINDIDILIPEKHFIKIIEILKNKKIEYNHDKKWHVLKILKDNLRIEFDSIDLWQKDLSLNHQEINLHGINMKILNLNILKDVYKKASEVSKDNPQGNKEKLKILNKVL